MIIINILLMSSFVMLCIIAILSFKTRYCLHREAKRAGRPSENEFISKVMAKGVSFEVAHAVYVGFQKWASPFVRDFPVAPTDRISLFIPVVIYEYETIIYEILKETRRYSPLDKPFPQTRKMTVTDVAIFVENCKKLL